MTCWMYLEGFQVVSSHFWALVCTGLTGWGHRSNRSECWTCSHVAHRSDLWCWRVWLVRAELLQLPCFKWCLACIGSGGACMSAGGVLYGFRALVWWFALFAWACYCLGCVEPLPLPKGFETCLLQVIFLFAFVWLSIACWSFFLFISFLFLFSQVTICVCCQCTHQGEIEDHVWFKDRWMVASWCDEWLTTLCGLILG
jgi:hypothetical protein